MFCMYVSTMFQHYVHVNFFCNMLNMEMRLLLPSFKQWTFWKQATQALANSLHKFLDYQKCCNGVLRWRTSTMTLQNEDVSVSVSL